MNKAEFELVKKAFAANKEANVLYFTEGGKCHTDVTSASQTGKEKGYKVVRRSQLEVLAKQVKTEAKDAKSDEQTV